jgi:hypothetical protein
MPSRWLSVLIVLFWLTTTGWLFWHDLWPSWRPGEPPPFHIDPVEEVRKGDSLKTFWIVERQNAEEVRSHPVFRASTCVDYQQEDDTYTLHAQLDATKNPKYTAVFVGIFKIDLMTSKYVVTRGGQLRSLQAEVKATPHLERLGQGLSLLRPLLKQQAEKGQKTSLLSDAVSLSIDGEVRGDRFFAHCQAFMPSSAKPSQVDLPPTTLSHTGSVLMPLHPVNRIHGLRLGQSWRQPLIDPLRDAFAGLPGFSGGVRSLNARVLSQPQMLEQGDSATTCLVIEYTDDEGRIVGSTWVSQDSERVQRQEANLDDGLWIMRRDLPSRGSGRIPNR